VHSSLLHEARVNLILAKAETPMTRVSHTSAWAVLFDLLAIVLRKPGVLHVNPSQPRSLAFSSG
jgi:hypothetical protein